MSPSNPISREDAGRAVDALLGFLRARAKQQKAQLFEHDDFLYLHISVRRFRSTSRLKPYRIPLPHALYPLDPSRTSLCLFADDSLADAARSTAADENLPFDSVIPLSQLRTDYVPFEARRRLCDSYDIFFAERRIIPLLPRIIGNYFFKKKKLPLAINTSRPGWPEAVREACRSSLLRFGSGTSSGLKVGRVSMDREEIIDNLMAVIEGAVEHVPKKWDNIRCMYIMSVQSVALPIYQAVPEMGMKIDAGRTKKEEHLDGMMIEETDVKRVVEEKNMNKSGWSKKRKLRIHDVDFTGACLKHCSEDEDRDCEEEELNDDLVLDNKVKKKKKDVGGKPIKGKKGRSSGNDKGECEENRNYGEFTEIGIERKKPKRAKNLVNIGVEEYGIKDSSIGDCKEIQLKKKMKNNVKDNVKKSKGKKGKKDNERHMAADKENLMNVDAATATVVADCFTAEDSDVKKRMNKNLKSGKVKDVKKVKKIKSVK